MALPGICFDPLPQPACLRQPIFGRTASGRENQRPFRHPVRPRGRMPNILNPHFPARNPNGERAENSRHR